MKSAKIKKISVACLAGLALMFSLVGLSSCKGKNIVSEYTVNDTFENIYINTSTADITICASLDGVCKVVSSASVYDRYNVSVQDGTLTVDLENIRKWYQFFDVNFDKSTLTVYLPETEYKGLIVDESTGDMDIQSGLQFESMDLSLSTGDVKCHASATELVKIKASTGNIIVENMQTKSMDISVSTGDVKVTDIVCDSLTASGNTSCFNGANIQASGAVTIIRSTGDILLENIQAEALTVTSDTGDQTISTATCGNVTLTITTG
jgi:DUF4097 and DUF4098 domain-containing protein YvlB